MQNGLSTFEISVIQGSQDAVLRIETESKALASLIEGKLAAIEETVVAEAAPWTKNSPHAITNSPR